MNIREVTEHITNSFLHISSSKVPSVTSLPRIINLLNKTKSEKAKAVEQAFFDFLRGEDSVIILSVSTSSKLFQFILKSVPSVWFIEGRIIDHQNKRKDVIALIFSHQKVTI